MFAKANTHRIWGAQQLDTNMAHQPSRGWKWEARSVSLSLYIEDQLLGEQYEGIPAGDMVRVCFHHVFTI